MAKRTRSNKRKNTLRKNTMQRKNTMRKNNRKNTMRKNNRKNNRKTNRKTNRKNTMKMGGGEDVSTWPLDYSPGPREIQDEYNWRAGMHVSDRNSYPHPDKPKRGQRVNFDSALKAGCTSDNYLYFGCTPEIMRRLKRANKTPGCFGGLCGAR